MFLNLRPEVFSAALISSQSGRLTIQQKVSRKIFECPFLVWHRTYDTTNLRLKTAKKGNGKRTHLVHDVKFWAGELACGQWYNKE